MMGERPRSVGIFNPPTWMARQMTRLQTTHRACAVVLTAMTALLPGASAATLQDEGATATDSLSITQCVQLARRAAPDVCATRTELEAARLDSAAVQRNRRPELAVIGGALVAPDGFYDPVITNLGEYQLKMGAQWPLVDGGSRRRARDRSTLTAQGAALELELSRRQAGLRAGALAAGILQLREVESAKRETLDWLNRLSALVEGGVRAGVRGRSDLLRVALERSDVQTTIDGTGVEREALARELGQLLGLPASTPPLLRTPDSAQDAKPTAADSARVFAAVANAPEVRQAQLAAALHRLDVDDVVHRSALQLELAADAGLAGADLTSAVPPDLQAADPKATVVDRLRRDLGASVSIQMRRPLLDRARELAVRSQEAGLRASALRLAAEQQAQTRLAMDLLARWGAAARRVASAQQTAEQAEENRLMQQSLYVSGATTLLELLDARGTLEAARARLASARLDQRMAQLEAAARVEAAEWAEINLRVGGGSGR
jgi:outer membrane protein TolC